MGDPPNSAADAIHRAVLEARRDGNNAALCEALDMLAQGTGENSFRFAANVIRGTKLGRRAIDDKAALRCIASFPVEQRRDAVSIIARRIEGVGATDKRVEATAQRLRRKLRVNETNKLVKFAASAS